jgi:hypothetical protein
VAIGLLISVAVTVSYWLGYLDGRSSRPESVPLRNVNMTPDLVPKERNETVEDWTRTPKRPMDIPPRDPAAKAHWLDLSLWYNAGLIGDWHGNQPENDFSTLPTGIQAFAGMEFDVRGLIQLHASDSGTVSYPRAVHNIPLGHRCRKLHFLHNTLFGRAVTRGQTIGAYIPHYADGKAVTVPLRMGENILDWWGSPDKLPPTGTTVLAWKGINGLSAKRGQSIHLNKFTWENSRPDVEQSALDFKGEAKTAGPFLVAVTAEP